MKATINGKRFDTETAELIGTASSDWRAGPHRRWEESLYRTPRRRSYFLAGRGGPLTVWGDARAWRDGCGIIPLRRLAAFDWAKFYLSPADFDSKFVELNEDA